MEFFNKELGFREIESAQESGSSDLSDLAAVKPVIG